MPRRRPAPAQPTHRTGGSYGRGEFAPRPHHFSVMRAAEIDGELYSHLQRLYAKLRTAAPGATRIIPHNQRTRGPQRLGVTLLMARTLAYCDHAFPGFKRKPIDEVRNELEKSIADTRDSPQPTELDLAHPRLLGNSETLGLRHLAVRIASPIVIREIETLESTLSGLADPIMRPPLHTSATTDSPGHLTLFSIEGAVSGEDIYDVIRQSGLPPIELKPVRFN